MASRLLRTMTVTAVGALCAGAVVALPAVISAGFSPASAADACPTGSASPTATASSTSSPTANPLASVIGIISPTPAASSASPSATATATVSPSPCPSPSASSPSATATATITPSASATPTATASPSATCRIVSLRVTTKTINATGLASVTVMNAEPNTRVELQGYSQNHYGTASFGNDTTNPDRAGTADENGAVTFSDLRPGSNTRLRARNGTCAYSASDVINVRTQLSLAVTRTGTRTYAFDVDSIPARPGGLIVSIYRITGSSCAAGVEPRSCPGESFVGQTRVSSANGAGRVTFTFDRTYPAREQFVLKTGQDAQNFPGRSNVRDLAVF